MQVVGDPQVPKSKAAVFTVGEYPGGFVLSGVSASSRVIFLQKRPTLKRSSGQSLENNNLLSGKWLWKIHWGVVAFTEGDAEINVECSGFVGVRREGDLGKMR